MSDGKALPFPNSDLPIADLITTVSAPLNALVLNEVMEKAESQTPGLARRAAEMRQLAEMLAHAVREVDKGLGGEGW